MKRFVLYWPLTFLLGAMLGFSTKTAFAEEPSSDYKLSAQDIIVISVVGERDLQQECRVTSSGTITYAWLSNVEVAGKTAAEVEQQLRKLLDKDYLVDPTVLVAVKEYRTKEVTVMGLVNKPGSVPIPSEQNLTVVDAIGKAGGIARGGNANSILLQRRGQTTKTRLKMEDLQRISDPDKMIYVQPGDVIEVTEKAF
jgi:protein involved in polysaccharide export with SLBB domain